MSSSATSASPNKFVRFLGSVQLAVPLLGAIALILMIATFYESQVGTRTVQRLVYKSPWFGALMFLLAINLGISTLSRYPWRGARKIGFALTHWGLVVLIAGSAAVIHISTEGMLLVRTDSGPNNQIRVEGDALEVVDAQRHRQQTDIFVRTDGSVYPSEFAGLSLVGYSDDTMETVSFTDGGSVRNMAVHLGIKSDRMGQRLERWLAVAPMGYDRIDLGPAQLEIVQAATPAEAQQWLSPPQSSPAQPNPTQPNLTQPNPPETIGALGRLQLNRALLKGQQQTDIDIETSIGQPISLTNDITATVTDVWPDFRLDRNNQPTSASNQFRNPALQLLLTQGDLEERWFVFANPDFSPIRSSDAIALVDGTVLDTLVTYEAPTVTDNRTDVGPDSFRPDTFRASYFRIVAMPNQPLRYAVRSSKGFTTGTLTVGESLNPGWADITITLLEKIDQAQIQRQTVPVTPVASGILGGGQAGNPALQIKDASGQESWLPWGTPTAIDTPTGALFAAFSPKLIQLPFYVKLNDFIVERNEGSESVAMWTSQVTLFDPERDTAVQRSVWMNHPTWFRGWKLAQASWNPGDLSQSTLQLKREPWWVTALTWLGSGMVVSGIGIMFYGRPLSQSLKSVPILPRVERNGSQKPDLSSANLSSARDESETVKTGAIAYPQ